MQGKLFSLDEGERLKREGRSSAARGKKRELHLARQIAREIALQSYDFTCHADLVQARLIEMGISLGNAAGSIFTKKEWEFTGEFVKSRRASNRARFVRIWRLRLSPNEHLDIDQPKAI